MPHSYAQILLHLVFATHQRQPFLADPTIREELYRYLGGIGRQMGCPILAAGGAADHVHTLASLARTVAVADLLEDLKGSSSKWIKEKGSTLWAFQWQKGYAAFSVSQSQAKSVRRYIDGQEEHHRRVSFETEFVELLQRHQVPYDERYMWD
jgi:REP element-mobilizing transposase RayT